MAKPSERILLCEPTRGSVRRETDLSAALAIEEPVGWVIGIDLDTQSRAELANKFKNVMFVEADRLSGVDGLGGLLRQLEDRPDRIWPSREDDRRFEEEFEDLLLRRERLALQMSTAELPADQARLQDELENLDERLDARAILERFER